MKKLIIILICITPQLLDARCQCIMPRHQGHPTLLPKPITPISVVAPQEHVTAPAIKPEPQPLIPHEVVIPLPENNTQPAILEPALEIHDEHQAAMTPQPQPLPVVEVPSPCLQIPDELEGEEDEYMAAEVTIPELPTATEARKTTLALSAIFAAGLFAAGLVQKWMYHTKSSISQS